MNTELAWRHSSTAKTEFESIATASLDFRLSKTSDALPGVLLQGEVTQSFQNQEGTIKWRVRTR